HVVNAVTQGVVDLLLQAAIQRNADDDADDGDDPDDDERIQQGEAATDTLKHRSRPPGDGVARATHGLDQRPCSGCYQLAAQVVDVEIDVVPFEVGIVTPDMLEDLVAAEDLARVA